MANETEKVNTIAIADIEKISGKTDDNIEKISGLEFTGAVPDWKGSRAILMGGWFYNASGSARSAISVQYKTLSSDANTSDFGDLATAKENAVGSGSNGTRVVMGGGIKNISSGYFAERINIDYVTAASVGTVGDAGDLQTAADQGSKTGASNGTLCFFVGGYINSSGSYTDRMEQMNISTTSGSSTAGDLQFGTSRLHTCSSGDSKSLIMHLGTAESAKTAIDTHNFSTSGNSSAYGSVATIAGGRVACVSATNRVVGGGGYISFGPTVRGTRLSFYPVASNADGDSSDSADLVVGAAGHGSTSDGTRGEFYGGMASLSDGYIQNDMQKITIASLSNATDFGNLTTVDSASDHYSTGDSGGIADLSAESAITS